MGEVVLFPINKRLPKGIEEEVQRIAKEYIEVLYAALNILSGEEYSREKYEEINELVAIAYAEGLCKAVDELEEES